MSGAPDARADSALALLAEVRRAFSLPPLAAGELGEQGVNEAIEAEPLLSMLASRVRDAAPGPSLREELRQAWNKAVRRRGWKHLPSIEGAVAEPARKPSLSEDPAQLVAAFLECFGVPFEPRGVSHESLSLAHVLCGVLMREVDALRATPLASPEEYAIRYHALVARWNELVRRAPDLPRVPDVQLGAS